MPPLPLTSTTCPLLSVKNLERVEAEVSDGGGLESVRFFGKFFRATSPVLLCPFRNSNGLLARLTEVTHHRDPVPHVPPQEFGSARPAQLPAFQRRTLASSTCPRRPQGSGVAKRVLIRLSRCFTTETLVKDFATAHRLFQHRALIKSELRCSRPRT